MSMTPDHLFEQLLGELEQQNSLPVDQWQPPRNGRVDIRIDREGCWFHEGVQIRRDAMVRLFARILRRDPDGYVLVTPVERLLIEVEDVPFVAIDCDVRARGSVDSPVSGMPTGPVTTDLLFTTNVGDLVLAGLEHPLRMAVPCAAENGKDAALVPYLHVRGELEARITRSVYYRLLEHLYIEDGVAYLASGGARFSLGAAG